MTNCNIQDFSSKIDSYLPIVLTGNSTKIQPLILENNRKKQNMMNYANCINNNNDSLLFQPIKILNLKLNKIKNENGRLNPTQTVQFLIDDDFNNLLSSTENFLSRMNPPSGGRRKRKSRKMKKLKRKYSKRTRY